MSHRRNIIYFRQYSGVSLCFVRFLLVEGGEV